jgi:CheY-like chemotaxis protein/two-component sensor histidine kinase
MMANNAIAERDKAIHALDRANAIKSMFLANTSHNLLTPLNSVLGYCEAARDKMPEIAPEIEGIRITVDQLSRQIKANIEKSFDLEGHDEFLEEFSPIEILRRIATVIRPFANNKEIEIRITSTVDNDSIYFGALDAITVCMLNLAENAVKYSDGRTIQLSVSKGTDSGSLQFSVLDDGQGIPTEDQAKIFYLFYRAKNNDTQGWGLGLSIVKETLDKLGGNIQLKSQPNETEFTFTVPSKIVGNRQKYTDRFSKLQISKTNSISILFVDDETPARKTWGTAIRKTGHFVHVAAGGLEALKSIESGNRYHLYMLDYRMPDMNGLELAKQIRDIEPSATIVIISAEVNKNNQAFNDAIESGLIDATISKPIHINELLALIEKYQKTEDGNTDDHKTAIFDELTTITFDLGYALQTGNDDAADKLTHRAKNLTSFIDDQTTIKAISAAKTPLETLNALRALLH